MLQSRAKIRFYCLLLPIMLVPQLAVAEETPNSSVVEEPPVTETDRRHWSFYPFQDVDIPGTQDQSWGRNEIDAFILARLESENLQPQPAAVRRTLIRRLSFDLTGLPPTPAQVEAFLSEESPDAYLRLVDRLLNSEEYGERWAQHWLDLARFAETDGFEHDKIRPEAWKFRDWVIRSLNADMPYDRFIHLQIAGDELEPDNPDAVTATQFCLSGPDMPDINSQDERRHTLLNELTSTVGSVVLGLQLGCAQCHDHKYDPISQADFYRMRAFFEPAVHLQKNKSVSTLKDQPPFDSPGHLMLRGDYRRPGPALSPEFIRVANHWNADFDSSTSLSHSSGRRTQLARWLTDSQNPLTARVIVNRVWQHHFGTGLSDSPSDFGIMGTEPTHHELLDWLSTWFIEHDWSLKQLHQLIVTSSTWRQRSQLPSDASDSERQQWNESLSVDRNASLLSRYPRWRLEGEAVRDAMLVSAGILNSKRYGPGVRPPLPRELVGTLLKNQWKITEDESEHTRRSIYVFARRNLRYPIFDVFDRPDANVSCPERGVSTTAPQSLHLLNSEFTLNMATQFADSVRQEYEDPVRQIKTIFQRALARYPTESEVANCREFLNQQQKLSNETSPLAHLCLVVFNLNEFIIVD